jgi:hypothetical protein
MEFWIEFVPRTDYTTGDWFRICQFAENETKNRVAHGRPGYFRSKETKTTPVDDGG